ncbi:LuxR C-terminal-related transcriptional regulator [Streptomyces sp. NPDC048448]|uniref:LuxR C-terminal-related transcriptional regulator n=1 Tax=Streptomyces sp. NPDC048448 TaxID=3365554 RepID=UPI003723E5DE
MNEHVIAQNGSDVATGRLVGRSAELALVDAHFAKAATRGAVLTLTGEAGVGKSALLDAASRRAVKRGFRVLRVAGSQFDHSVSFAGLNQVLQPLTGEIATLPKRQAHTLQAILGLSAGKPVQLLAVANAVQGLLSQICSRSPLALIVDDYAWLDRPSAVVLGTVARYVSTMSVALLTASRTGDESFLPSTGIDTYEVQPLDVKSATKLVAERFPGMTPRVRRRLVTEACGNPLALLELSASLNIEQQTQRRSLPSVLPLTERLRTVFSKRVSALPDATRKLLLLAVLDGSGELHILQRAVGRSGALSELSGAERVGLVRVDAQTGRLVFRHPLTRSAVVELSTVAERRWAHRALANELPEGSERQAWHLAGAAVGPDDQVAEFLHEVAHTTLRRGDAVGAITALLRASELSSTGADRGRRLAEAACLGANVTGDLRHVRALLDDAVAADPLGGPSLAAVAAAASQLLNGEGDVDTAHRLLAVAIDNHAAQSPAEDTFLGEVLHALLMVSFFSGRAEPWHSFDSAVARLHSHTADPLLTVLRGSFGDPAHAALPVLPLLDELIDGLHRETDPTRIIRTAFSAAYVDRLPGCRSALWRVIDDGRGGGAVASAMEGLFLLATDAWATGQWDMVTKLIEEAQGWGATYDYRLRAWQSRFIEGLLAAARGDDEAARNTADRLASWGNPRGLGLLRSYASHIKALSALGRTDFDSAYQHLSSAIPAGRLAPHNPHILRLIWDFTEAATRTGHHDEAAAHLAAVRDSGIPSISPRLSMITKAATAMANPRFVDRELFDTALATPDAERWPFDLARIRLGYGERLRRSQAYAAARTHLEAALDTFESLAAAPWSARTAGELYANGLPTAAVPTVDRKAPLTPQEWRVAQLAATGLTNKQIAAQLFLSPRTVGSHLRNVFPKLNITYRAGLRDALTSLDLPPVDGRHRLD